jgi:antitoxin component YwqK of YwqJK toxin-antitoxin module
VKKKEEKNYNDRKENGVRGEWDEDGKKTLQENFIDGVEGIK